MKNSTLYLSVLIYVVLAMFVGNVVYAHGEGDGASFETVVDGYFVDIGYRPAEITTETSTQFSFLLFEENSNEDTGFTDLWVRITKEGRTLFASGIHRPKIGGTNMLFTFPEGGTYEVHTRFQKDGETLTEISFPIEVAEEESDTPREQKFPTALLGAILAGFLVGGTVVMIFKR